MKSFRYFSQAIVGLTPKAEHTRLLVDQMNKLSEAFRREFLKNALVATQANLDDAKSNLKEGKVNITNARKYLEDAVMTADVIYNDKNTAGILDEGGKKLLSATYACYADFLRWSTTCDQQGIKLVKENYDKALLLDPTNSDAIATQDHMKFSYRMD
jgi:hypothetical protein